MQQAIVSFDTDEHGDWFAILKCGHMQHVRHRPPFFNWPWVISESGRSAMLGRRLECPVCDEDASR